MSGTLLETNPNTKQKRRNQLIILLLLLVIVILSVVIVSINWWRCDVSAVSKVNAVSAPHRQQLSLGPSSTPASNLSILCLIHTVESRHSSVAIHTKQTWVQHCNYHLFVSNVGDTVLEPFIPAVVKGVKVAQLSAWYSLHRSLSYAYANYGKDIDWVLSVPDDNYVIIENLRYMLSSYSSEEPIHFGCKLKNKYNEPYMSSASPIVLSREALRRFVEIALNNQRLCNRGNDGVPDEELGKCLKNVEVQFGDSRDVYGAHTILPFEAETHLYGLNKTLHAWYYEKAFYPFKNDYVPVSRNAISFHVNYAPLMYTYDYMIYKVRRFGRVPKNLNANEENIFLRSSQQTTKPSIPTIPTQSPSQPPQPPTLPSHLHPKVIPPKPLYEE